MQGTNYEAVLFAKRAPCFSLVWLEHDWVYWPGNNGSTPASLQPLSCGTSLGRTITFGQWRFHLGSVRIESCGPAADEQVTLTSRCDCEEWKTLWSFVAGDLEQNTTNEIYRSRRWFQLSFCANIFSVCLKIRITVTLSKRWISNRKNIIQCDASCLPAYFSSKHPSRLYNHILPVQRWYYSLSPRIINS